MEGIQEREIKITVGLPPFPLLAQLSRKRSSSHFYSSPAWFPILCALPSSHIYSFFITYSPTVIFLYFLHRLVMHRTFQMHSDCLISIFTISDHQVKEYKCLFSRVRNGSDWVQWLFRERTHAKSVNHSIWKMNGMFWSSLPFVSGEWLVLQ